MSRVIWAWTAALLTLAAAAGMAAAFAVHGYLPQPIYYKPDDSLMDLYSTAYWANTAGAYALWHAIYPPLSFAFLKVFSAPQCFRVDGFGGRGCDWTPAATLGAFYLLNIVLVFYSLRIVDRRTAIPRTVVLAAGLPMLYALERGNLLIPAFTGYVLGFGGLIAGTRARAVAMAWAINFKPYLLIAAIGRFARRDWRWFLRVGAAVAGLYAASYLFYGSGTLEELVRHESHYAVATGERYFADLYYSTSYWPLIRLLRASPAGLRLMAAPWSEVIALVLDAAIRLAQLGAAVCLALSLRFFERVDPRRFGALFVCLALTAFTTGSAGYTQIFLFFLLFLEPRRGGLYAVMVGCVYLASLPVDFVFHTMMHGPVQSFFGRRQVNAEFGVSVGQLLRPGVLLVIQAALTLANFRDLLGRSQDGVAAAPPNR